eukprot:3262972-Lingulodinium_polyedra.AAC.1
MHIEKYDRARAALPRGHGPPPQFVEAFDPEARNLVKNFSQAMLPLPDEWDVASRRGDRLRFYCDPVLAQRGEAYQ